MDFKNRGHFCNYCRKVISNKTYEKYQSPTVNINTTIWNVWNSYNPTIRSEFVQDLSNLVVTEKAKGFNTQLKQLRNKYGEGVKIMNNVLECSTKGDKRFSALCAKVEVFGVENTIEYYYQTSKVFVNITNGQKVYPTNVVEAKSYQKTTIYKLVSIRIHGIDYDLKYLSDWYILLWCKYFKCNNHLLDIIAQFDEFHDIFKGKHTVNCQADVIRRIKKEGLPKVLASCKEFCSIMYNTEKARVR